MEIDHSNNQFIKNGITFSVSLVFGFALFSLFAPAFRSHAEDKSTQELSAEVNPVVSVSAPEELNFTITPTSSGSFDSKELRVNVSTNAIKGYELYFSSEDEQTNMKHTSPSVSNTISSAFTGSLTSANMQKNTWGYSLNNTDFKSIPTKSHQVKLKDLKSYPTPAERVQSVYFGVKADTTLPSGSYEKNVVFTALAHANPLRKVGILKLKTMQQMTSNACDENTTPNSTARQIDTDGSHHEDPNYIPTVTLTDTRDNNTYTVSKLADGRCWMTKNLRIVDKTITPGDSDVENNYTIPPSIDEYTNFDDYNKSGAYLDNTYGAYYTWFTATAGTGTDTLPANHNTSHSICPRGWQLPRSYDNTGSYENTEYNRLVESYPLDETTGLSPLAAAPFNFTNASGYIANGITSQNDISGWWSSTVYAPRNSYDLQNSGSVIYSTDVTSQYRGLHVRCVNAIER